MVAAVHAGDAFGGGGGGDAYNADSKISVLNTRTLLK